MNKLFKRLITLGNANDLKITSKAALQLAKINSKQAQNQFLRVQIDAGGCHGFQYKMELTDKQEDGDM
jgi:Fe-S cluster assembly iron-binding protein IscA